MHNEIKVPAEGPLNAAIMFIGEAPGGDEVAEGRPFVGLAGSQFDSMLHEANIYRTECYITNACKYRPPRFKKKSNNIEAFFYDTKQAIAEADDAWYHNGKYANWKIKEGYEELLDEIAQVDPIVIVALGNTPMWMLLGYDGITQYRNGTYEFEHPTTGRTYKVVPTIHPSAVNHMYEFRKIVIHDLKHVTRECFSREIYRPNWHFQIRPTFSQVMGQVNQLLVRANNSNAPLRLAVDTETRTGYLACVGFAWNELEAMCVPFMCVERKEGYWTFDEEWEVMQKLIELFSHPNVEIIGQHFHYDSQYLFNEWGLYLPADWDTELMQHVCFPGLLGKFGAKSLLFLSSMYCRYHRYWKDDGKEWKKDMGEDSLWIYNCEDCVRTFEVFTQLHDNLEFYGLEDQYAFLRAMIPHVLDTMLKGVLISERTREEFRLTLLDERAKREAYLDSLFNERTFGVKSKTAKPWYRSATQQANLFYDVLRLPIPDQRFGRSLKDEILPRLAKREPLIAPICDTIKELRSIGVFHSTFINAKLDPDKRMRCEYSLAGTETFRLSSSRNVYDRGTNLQNVPDPSEELTYLPHVRRMFIPDAGYTIFDCDLEKADAQVVAWDADDASLKQMFREGVNIHIQNAKDIFNVSHVEPGDKYYKMAKRGVHAANYRIRPRTLAQRLGITVHESEMFIRRWYEAHPAIPLWHDRIEEQIQTSRTVHNAFGFRRVYFTRIDDVLKEAVAWIPQSTVALAINHGWRNIATQLPEIDVLLQVHDSLVFQIPTARVNTILPQVRKQIEVTIPYEDPLVIPANVKGSTVSWGDCASDERWDKLWRGEVI